jgi:hypothetical protein
MGISRAQELARFVKETGRRVPADLLDAALDPNKNITELHVQVQEAMHVKEGPSGTWYEPLGGAYYTPDEKKEVQQAIDLARRDIDPTLPDHVIRKQVMLAFAREFYSSNIEGAMHGV